MAKFRTLCPRNRKAIDKKPQSEPKNIIPLGSKGGKAEDLPMKNQGHKDKHGLNNITVYEP